MRPSQGRELGRKRRILFERKEDLDLDLCLEHWRCWEADELGLWFLVWEARRSGLRLVEGVGGGWRKRRRRRRELMLDGWEERLVGGKVGEV